MLSRLLGQLRKKPATNPFLARHLPSSVVQFTKDVAEGRATMAPAVPIPPQFKGRITFDRETCIGCWLCIKVCSAHAIEAIPEKKKVRVIVSQCISCAQCTVICPKDSLWMSEDYLISDTDRYSKNLVLE
jgi:formate hydrogenlyase subunit 6/NADH:ubiquinone oxidoreductase subunit I